MRSDDHHQNKLGWIRKREAVAEGSSPCRMTRELRGRGMSVLPLRAPAAVQEHTHASDGSSGIGSGPLAGQGPR